MKGLDLVHDCLPLVFGGKKDDIIVIHSDHRHVGGNHDHIQLVNLVKFGRLGVGGAGHSRQPIVELEEILDRDRGHGLRFLLDGNALLGLDRLVQPVGPLPADHLPSGVLIDDDDRQFALFVRGDDIVAITLIDSMGANGLLQQVGNIDVFTNVERSDAGDALGFGDPIMRDRRLLLIELELVELRVLVAGRFELRQPPVGGLQPFFERCDLRFVAGVSNIAFQTRSLDQTRMHFLISRIPFLLLPQQIAGELVGHVIARRIVVREPRNDQRRTRLINERRIHFIDDGKVAMLLHLLSRAELHVVAQIIESELARRTVDHLALVGGQLLLVGLHMARMDGPHGHSQRPEKWEGPVTIALDEIVVDGNDMNLLPFQDGQVTRKRGNNRFPLAGLHLRDSTFIQNHGADDLHIKGPSAVRRLRLGIQLSYRLIELGRNVDEQPGRHRLAGTEKIAGRLRRFGCLDLRLDLVVELPRVIGKLRCVEIMFRVEDVSYADVAVHRFSGDREDLRQNVVRLLAGVQTLAECVQHAAEFRIAQRADVLLLSRHLIDDP